MTPGVTGILPMEGRAPHHGRVGEAHGRYLLKADPYSSHSLMLRWLGEGNGRAVLDVGAADGLLSRHLRARGWRVTAIEADPGLARAGAVHCDRMLVADLNRETPPLHRLFDAIVFGDVLEHLTEPSRVLAEMGRALAPGGRVVISIPNVAHLWMRLSLLAGRFEYAERGILDRTHLRFFTARTLTAMVTAAGLAIVRRSVTPVPLHHVVTPRWHGACLDAVHAASAVAARALPRLLGYQFVVLAERAKP
ncbi:MAG: class I SAM-dependent methyltransferase [Candidatus Rokuibacteriota bacterium]